MTNVIHCEEKDCKFVSGNIRVFVQGTDNKFKCLKCAGLEKGTISLVKNEKEKN